MVTGRFGGWTGWLMKKLARRECAPPRLEILERLTLAPRQSVALIEADGRRILVATSGDGGPAFYPLDGGAQGRPAERRAARVSW
jgi:flagellar biogenesis protein FliO